MKECSKCKVIKPLCDYYTCRKSGICKECLTKESLAYYNKNKEKCIANSKKWNDNNADKRKAVRKKLYQKQKENGTLTRNRKRYPYSPYLKNKVTVMEHYGNKCVCCGIDILTFLSIDHIEKDGYKFKTPNGKRIRTGNSLYKYIIENNFPNDLRILCFNCHFGTHANREVCPHKEL